jgi:hypothetical protein
MSLTMAPFESTTPCEVAVECAAKGTAAERDLESDSDLSTDSGSVRQASKCDRRGRSRSRPAAVRVIEQTWSI